MPLPDSARSNGRAVTGVDRAASRRVMTRILALSTALAVTACGTAAAPTVDDNDDLDNAEVAAQADPDDALVPLAASLTPAVAITPGCVAHASLAGFSTWFFFTRPDRPCVGDPGTDMNAVNELQRLIGTVPAGGRIDGHIYSISIDGVAKALLDAQTRGVDVRISTDGGVASSTDSAKTSYLDKLTHKVYCKHSNNTACISTIDDAISHTKLFVFSRATAPDGAASNNVVWMGSANQTYASGARLYNNTVTVYGEASLYTQLQGYLGDLYNQTRVSDYYDPATGRGHFLAASADVYASPEATTDLVVNRLDDITPDDTCRVRVMQASIRDSRMDVVNEIIQLKNGGCHTWVVADTVEPDALKALKAAKIPVHHMPIHDKSFIVFAKYGTESQYRIYTGSHNLSGGSAHRYDEIFVKLAPETGTTHPIYDAYFTHFNDAYNTGAAL
jgi:phosphatidylserine/phosphatidylglycerophosphate/cardiolipin synthase-like enzyme